MIALQHPNVLAPTQRQRGRSLYKDKELFSAFCSKRERLFAQKESMFTHVVDYFAVLVCGVLLSHLLRRVSLALSAY
jgi:hypothetical protein